MTNNNERHPRALISRAVIVGPCTVNAQPVRIPSAGSTNERTRARHITHFSSIFEYRLISRAAKKKNTPRTDVGNSARLSSTNRTRILAPRALKIA